jgi:hypothetical protein
MLHDRYFAQLDTYSELHQYWCAILGLHQFNQFAGFVGLCSANRCLWPSRAAMGRLDLPVDCSGPRAREALRLAAHRD